MGDFQGFMSIETGNNSSNNRVIFHIDVNSAFLSWSAVKRLREDPNALDLRTVPSAVGGDVESRHGIITARSIPAKKYGIKTADPVVKALQKCPNLILIPSDFKTYREYSKAFITILEKYGTEVEQVSIDEAFLDMTGTEYLFADEIKNGDRFPICAARKIKDEIRDTLGFTVNVGISTNKLLAKMASDFQKPDKIHTLYLNEIKDKMWPLPIGDLFGCGKRTANKLMQLGIRTIGDAAVMDISVLKGYLGENSGAYIHNAANGISYSEVSSVREKAKSYSNETTTSVDITASNYEQLLPPEIDWLSESVSRRMTRDHVRANTVTIIVKTNDFKRHTRQTKLPYSINDADTIKTVASALFTELLTGTSGLFYQGLGLRLIGVGCSGLDDEDSRQLDLFDWMSAKKQIDENKENEAKEKARIEASQEKQKKLEEMLSKLKSKYGDDIIKKGDSE